MSRFFYAVGIVVACWSTAAWAQQATIGTPFRSANDSFFERIGTNWSLRGPNWFANFGGNAFPNPPFGRPDPSAGISSGFFFGGKNVSGQFNFTAGQGYRSSLVSQTPSVTLMNGQTGYFSDTSQSPFVISYIPVVGGFPAFGVLQPQLPPSAFITPVPGFTPSDTSKVAAMRRMLAERQAAESQTSWDGNEIAPPQAGKVVPQPPAPRKKPTAVAQAEADPPKAVERPAAPAGGERFTPTARSSADIAVPSVAEARRLHEQEKATGDQEVLALVEKARAAEEEGKQGVARIYYGMAARRAQGELREELESKLRELGSSGSSGSKR